MENLDCLTIGKGKTIKEGMKKIDESETGSVFVLEEDNRVCGVITDGDIRRAILRGYDVLDKIEEVMREDYVSIFEEDLRDPKILSEKIQKLYERDNLAKFLPVLDSSNNLKSLFYFGLFEGNNKKVMEKEGKRFLIVGGAGYLGSLLIEKLLSRGHNVRVLDINLFGTGHLKDLEKNPNLELINGDVRNIQDVSSALKDVDGVVHLAAIVGDPACQSTPEDTIETNYLATKMLADACKYNQINRFIFASTCSVYGVGDEQLTEESPLNPVSLYARTKIKSEEAILNLVDDNFSPCMMRMATLYGYSPRMRFDLVVNTLTMKAVSEGKINIFGGDQWRPLLHVEDAAEAYVKCLEAPISKIRGAIFNVGSTEQNYQISELGEAVCKLIPGTEISFEENESIGGKKDERTYNVSFDKIKRDIDFNVKRSLEESILEIKSKIDRGEVKNVKDSIHYNYVPGKREISSGRIPYSTMIPNENDISAVVETLKSGWLAAGPRVQEFEETFAKYVGAKYGVVVSNGTAALHLACLAAGLGSGDELITSPMTFAASANCALYCGAKPVFVDIDEQGLIDIEKIEEKITDKTKILIPVHYSGIPCNMERLGELASKHGLTIIEDACHAVGAKYKDEKIGSCQNSDMAVFSFHPVKHLTMGEGGIITTNSKEIYDKLRSIRSHGMVNDKNLMWTKDGGDWFHEMHHLGFNYRSTDIQAALGVSQLKNIDQFVGRRREIAKRYSEAFKDLTEVELIKESENQYNANHLSVLKVESAEVRKELFNFLKKNEIFCQIHYIPVYLHPYYQNLGYQKGLCPNVEKFYDRIISIPNFPQLKDSQQEKVIEKINEFYDKKRSGKVGIIIQARMASSRLPGKVLKNLSGEPFLKHIVERCKKSSADEVIVATSTNIENDSIEKFCEANGYSYFRGSEDNVLERYYDTSRKFDLKTIVRICADDPLIDPETIDDVIDNFEKGDYDYVSNVMERSYPRGLDVEVFSFSALERAHELAEKGPEKEHVTSFIYSNPQMFKLGNVFAEGIFRRPNLRLCVDTPEDFRLMKIIYNNFYGLGKFADVKEVVAFLDNNPEIAKSNLESEKEQQMRNLQDDVRQSVI